MRCCARRPTPFPTPARSPTSASRQADGGLSASTSRAIFSKGLSTSSALAFLALTFPDAIETFDTAAAVHEAYVDAVATAITGVPHAAP